MQPAGRLHNMLAKKEAGGRSVAPVSPARHFRQVSTGLSQHGGPVNGVKGVAEIQLEQDFIRVARVPAIAGQCGWRLLCHQGPPPPAARAKGSPAPPPAPTGTVTCPQAAETLPFAPARGWPCHRDKGRYRADACESSATPQHTRQTWRGRLEWRSSFPGGQRWVPYHRWA